MQGDKAEYNISDLIKFIENLKRGRSLTQKHKDMLNDIIKALYGFKLSSKDTLAKAEFHSKHLKQVYAFLQTLNK